VFSILKNIPKDFKGGVVLATKQRPFATNPFGFPAQGSYANSVYPVTCILASTDCRLEVIRNLEAGITGSNAGYPRYHTGRGAAITIRQVHDGISVNLPDIYRCFP
jgi:hypothetical protein